MASKDYKQLQVYPKTFDIVQSLIPEGVPRARYLHFIFTHLDRDDLIELYSKQMKKENRDAKNE